jgi:hypothetical protein
MFDPADDSLTPIDSSESSHRYPAVALDSGVVTVGDRWLDVAEGSWHDADPIPEPFREFPVAGGHGDTFYVWGGDACGPAASCTALVDPGPGLAWTAAAS